MRPLRRVVGVTVLSHPTGPRQQLVVALHVQQGHLTDRRVEQLRAQHGTRPDQQSPLGTPHDTQASGGCNFARYQVLGDSDEVLVHLVPVLPKHGVVPGRPELTSAADIGHNPDAAALQPGGAGGAGVTRQ